ncbi:phage structural protein [Mycobacteroides abscessus subsp. massiliense]|uniref:major capsid protein n=1 Tax=Mycobacteroides abscessus TaxID=36809 RepID=UPI0009A6D912|nr:major capsid protein [Mycobacteroides abscessus]SKU70566.1 phage structural protein [Mycobacteroides abscessus subsp. massiliense]SKU76343.1 phage structural protein [Mycobacteroides abscessus subsp. massiliense]
MAIVFDGPVSPDALTTFIRNVPVESNLALVNLFPTRYLDSNRVDWAEFVKTNRTAAYRSFDGSIHVSSRDAGSGKYVELLPFSDSLNKGEYERIAQEIARLGGTNKAAQVNAAYNDAERLVGTMNNRRELAWGDVLTDGKLTINEGGFSGEADYGVPANQIVSAGTAWSNHATSTPLTDLDAWQEVRIANGYGRATQMILSRVVQGHLRRNTEVINAVHGAAAQRTSVTLAELNTLLASEDLPVIRQTYDTSLSVEGTTTRVLAQDRVIILPENLGDLGFFAYGLSATALELAKSNLAEMTFGNAAGIVGVVEKVGPPYREFTFVDAVGMPILTNAGLLSVADVL